jgi:hypothetical protein
MNVLVASSRNITVRFEIPMAVIVKIIATWDMTPFSNRHFYQRKRLKDSIILGKKISDDISEYKICGQ